jgi:hypothetical protein
LPWTGLPFLLAFGRLMEILVVLALSTARHWAQARLDTLCSRFPPLSLREFKLVPQAAMNRNDNASRPMILADAVRRLRTLPRAACAMFCLVVPL